MKDIIASILFIVFVLAGVPGIAAASKQNLGSFKADGAPCYDRLDQAQTPVVDTHLHFRPFGGPAVPFEEVVSYLKENGVLFVNIYGIGQMLPPTSSCSYYLDCPGTPVSPTLKNDFVNAANYTVRSAQGIHMTLSMSFPDLSRPESILSGMQLLEQEYPGAFTWMGEVNLVKQALFGNGRAPVPIDKIPAWADFMKVLRERDIPLSIHADLGNNEEPVRYLPLMKEVLHSYPDNKIVWMHMGLSREQVNMNVALHIQTMKQLLDLYPKLMLDISWRVLDDSYFSNPDLRKRYVPFLNQYSERILPGTDFVASGDKNAADYRTELRVTSGIFRYLSDRAFRNIALGQNYFRLLGLDYTAPQVCTDKRL